MDFKHDEKDTELLRKMLLECIYKNLEELKTLEKPEPQRFRHLLELAEFTGNPNNSISLHQSTHNHDHFSLIKGVFSCDDANNILGALFNSKIDFHVRSAVSHHLRNGEPSPAHSARIRELQEAYDKIKDLIVLASDCSMKIKINALVDIELVTA